MEKHYIIHVLQDGGVITYITEEQYQELRRSGGPAWEEFYNDGYEEVFLKNALVVRKYIQARQTLASIDVMSGVNRLLHRGDAAKARDIMADCIADYEEGDNQ